MMETATFPLELKSADASGLIEGVAAGVGDVDHGGDQIMPGAFSKTLAARGGSAVPMLLHHDQSRPIGTWTELKETPSGLVAKGRIIAETRDGADALALARAGALRGLSIGYVAQRKSFAGTIRQLHDIALHEISLVAIPMHERSVVQSVKSIGGVGDIRELLQQAGMSGRQAKAAAGAAWRAINETFSETDEQAAAELAAILDQSAARIAAL